LFAASGKFSGSTTTFTDTECIAASIGHWKADGRFTFQTKADDTE